MGVTYKKLWKLLIDKDLKKVDLKKLTGISPVTLSKISKNENINTDTIARICKALNCQPSDIMEYVDDDK